MIYGADDGDLSVIFNHGVLCFALSHAEELGILTSLESSGEYHFDPHSEPVKRQIGFLLTDAGITHGDPDQGHLYATRQIVQLAQVKGFFRWLFQASGEVLVRGPRESDSTAHSKFEELRSGDAIATATADFGRRLIDPVLLEAAEIQSARGLIDLGCGDGSRLIYLCSQLQTPGLGIDISGTALDKARHKVWAAGLSEKILFQHHDVRYVDSLPLGYTSFLMCLMGHDLWPEEECRNVLQRLRSATPDISSLVLVETVQAERKSGVRLNDGIPSIGYEYLHSLMGQPIPSEHDWDRVLAAAGWVVKRKVPLERPANTIIFFCDAR